MTSKLERLVNAALLDAALRSDETLVEIVNMFGKIHVHHDDEMEPQLKNLRAKIYRQVTETVLTSRCRELESRINRIIDRVIDADDRNKGQHEERQFPGAIAAGQDGAQATILRHPTRASAMQVYSRPAGVTSGPGAACRPRANWPAMAQKLKVGVVPLKRIRSSITGRWWMGMRRSTGDTSASGREGEPKKFRSITRMQPASLD